MASYPPTVSIDDPAISTGANGGGSPPAWADGGDDFDSPSFDARLRRARLGLFVGVVGIVMIFVSFSSAYIVRQGLPTFDSRTNSLVHDWIPVRLPRLLMVNTFVLLISSITIELARRRAVRNAGMMQRGVSITGVSAPNDEKISWLALTVALGLTFLVGQGMAWRELAASGFYISATPSSSFVFLLTGMHGAHLLGGVIALVIAGLASLLRRSAQSQLIWLDVTGWYWHFMAVLWVYILMLLEFVH
jgi:cytochrome c oxidase subunit III